ncbi:ThiF family adenylyltransferase [Deinococcus sp. VB343]|uniref:ThiF family adenylyltransferase n=1 Tax=Deinococcus sp. VB343 TaxID=3385567 RepID=UPI0039C9DBAF
MTVWWLSQWSRLGQERATIEALASAEPWFTLTRWTVHKFRLAVEGVITAHGADYAVRLVYPDSFPNVPAWVEPQDETAKWSHHQYGAGGVLCLELRPDNWRTDATGAEVLQSAFNLLYKENPQGSGDSGIVPSAHNVGNVQSYAWHKLPALISLSCLRRLFDGQAVDLQALYWQSQSDIWPILLTDQQDRESGSAPMTDDLGSYRITLPVLVAQSEVPHPQPSSRIELLEALKLEESATPPYAVVLAIAPDQSTLTIYVCLTPDTVQIRSLVPLPEETGRRSGRAVANGQQQVAIIGLGSVGSSVAELLLRSGVRRLVLVDGDVMLPGNLERHTLDWRDVGAHKTVAIKRRLLHIAPKAEIEIITANLNWQQSARIYSADIDEIAACTVIVNATGDVPTGLLLGSLAEQHRKALVSVEVFEGGLGCLTARFLPGRDPTYIQGRMAYETYCEVRNVTPPSSGVRTYEALTFDGVPMQADAAAVTAAAAQAARIALDILDDRVEATTSPWMLTGFRSGWLFSRQGDSVALDISLPTQPTPPARDSELAEWASALAKEAIDAARVQS